MVGIIQSEVTRTDRSAAAGLPQELRLAASGSVARDFLQLQGIDSPVENAPARHAPPLSVLAAAEVKVECLRAVSGDEKTRVAAPAPMTVLFLFDCRRMKWNREKYRTEGQIRLQTQW